LFYIHREAKCVLPYVNLFVCVFSSVINPEPVDQFILNFV
jgi:hypothetical protein